MARSLLDTLKQHYIRHFRSYNAQALRKKLEQIGVRVEVKQPEPLAERLIPVPPRGAVMWLVLHVDS